MIFGSKTKDPDINAVLFRIRFFEIVSVEPIAASITREKIISEFPEIYETLKRLPGRNVIKFSVSIDCFSRRVMLSPPFHSKSRTLKSKFINFAKYAIEY